MLGMGREDEDVDSEVGTVGGGESELFESDEDEKEQAFAVLEFAEELEEGNNVEEANVELLMSFAILSDLLISSVHVFILSGYLDRNSCILDSLPYLIQKSSLGDLGTTSNVLYDSCVGVLTFSIYSASTLYFLFFNVKYFIQSSLLLNVDGVLILLSYMDDMLESAMCSISGIMNTLSIIFTNRTVCLNCLYDDAYF